MPSTASVLPAAALIMFRRVFWSPMCRVRLSNRLLSMRASRVDTFSVQRIAQLQLNTGPSDSMHHSHELRSFRHFCRQALGCDNHALLHPSLLTVAVSLAATDDSGGFGRGRGVGAGGGKNGGPV